MSMNKHNREMGSINPLLISSIILGLLTAGFAGGFLWAYGNYIDQRDNTTTKVEAAVTDAKKQQATVDETQYLEKEKQPYLQLAGPDDLGRVSISYPKTWSVYVAKSSSDGYEAYLNSGTVPMVALAQPYAARVTVVNQAYDKVVTSFASLVKKGDLKSSPVSVNSFNGVRLDGKFSTTRSGSTVIFKVRDKALTVSTDSDSFKSDFDNIIVKSLDFNP
jgi:hypothetical protein